MAIDQDDPREPQSWVQERFATGALEYPVPARSNRIDFTFGALTLVSLTLLAISGSVLTLYYTPTPLAAHDSVRYMITGVPLVDLLRSVHVWSASAALAFVFAHLIAVFWRRGFRRPREGLWWTGVLLLALVFGLAFTGTVLRADQEGIEALAHATVGAGMAGPLGAPLRGDFTPSSAVLTRLYGLHIAVLPLALFALLGIHLWLIRHLGVSANHDKMVPFRAHLRLLGGLALILTALATILALVLPAELLTAGVPGYEVTKPFWPFLWLYAAENLFGIPGMLIAPGLLFGFLALVPVADRADGRAARLTRAAGVLLFLLMLAAIAYAALAPAQPHLGMAM